MCFLCSHFDNFLLWWGGVLFYTSVEIRGLLRTGGIPRAGWRRCWQERCWLDLSPSRRRVGGPGGGGVQPADRWTQLVPKKEGGKYRWVGIFLAKIFR